MMDISHLYHDAAFGDPTLELDVKEQLKTREVNAREERNLQRMHKSYDKELEICEKNTAWERWKVGKSLQGIWERSPRLEKRLAMEKARIEALERSILFRNYRRMNSQATDFSMGSRSVSRVTLKPLHDQKKTPQTKSNPKKKEKSSKENDDNNNNNSNNNDVNERTLGRQADFVRRSEHSIKALAKLNWKQQSRRRDHEKFKEDLFFHSKPVFEKAKVVLKGRPDIDVENLYTDLESILLPPVKKTPHFNLKPQFKNSNSNLNLYERNILRIGDSSERKRPPYLTPLAPLNEHSEPKAHSTNQTKSEHQSSSCEINDSNHSSNSGTSGHETKRHVRTSDDSSAVENNATSRSPHVNNSTSSTNETPFTNGDSNNDRLLDITQTPATSLTNDSPGITDKSSVTTENPSPTQQKNNKGVNTNDSTDSNSNSKTASSPKHHIEHHHQHNPDQQHQQQQQQQQQHVHTSSPPSNPFSPSTSISQVIIEEEEEDGELEIAKFVANPDDEIVSIDINNNSVISTSHDHHHQGVPEGDDEDFEGVSSAPYTMTCTTGLPQLWKQTKKPKEKAVPEVSATALARKHKRKRRDRW